MALWGLGLPEPAAVLLGKTEALEGRVHHGWEDELLAEVEVSLRQSLGESRFAELTTRGAMLDSIDAVAYVAAEAALALDEA